jgi:hypothetical protein
MSQKKLLSRYLRSVTGLAVGAVLWFAVGWALSSLTLGWALGAWVLFVGPLVIPTLTWFTLRVTGRLHRLSITPNSSLAPDYLAAILRAPGPAPRVWLREGHDNSFFWFETGLLKQSHQNLIITRGWLEQRDPTLRSRDWNALWDSIRALPRAERRLRNFQIAAWMGLFSPVDLLLRALHGAQILVGLHRLPAPAFWFQRVGWFVRATWFGLPPDPGEIPTLPPKAAVTVPTPWNSVLWGVWHQVPVDVCHPAWGVLLHEAAFLRPSSSKA